MPLSDHVTLSIVQNSTGTARAGFGVPMILSANASFSERLRTYTDLAGMATDGFATDSPEYRAARAMFAQSPHPTKIAVGRCASKPTLVYVVSVAAVRNSHAYKINVEGEGVTPSTITGTSDGSATNDEIAALLVTALNNVTGKNYTAVATGSGGSQVVTVTATNPGGWFSLEVADVSDLALSMTHADPGVAADLDAILLYNADWYAIATLYNSSAYVLAVAAWVESNGAKVYNVDVPDTAAITTAVTNGDTLDALHTLAYTRTKGDYHPSQANFLAAAEDGRVLPLDPGSETWKYKTLAGVAPVALTSTHRTNLLARKANSYQTLGGRNFTWEGTVADGNYLDVIRGLDWLRDDMSKSVFDVLAGAPGKVPFTDNGIAQIEAAVRASLKRAVALGIISDDYTLEIPKIADVSDSDKAARRLPGLKFFATLQGAIHSVSITGIVSV